MEEKLNLLKTIRKLFFVSLFLFSVLTVTANQQGIVTGKITDAENNPLPGVTIVIKGTTSGTVSDMNGDYSINAPQNTVLIFSFVGMKKEEVNIGNRTTVNVRLEEDSIGLDEVIAIGYGTMKKSDLTGSVQRVDAKNFKAQSITQLTDMLAGTVAGFNSNQGTSAQGGGSMEIRGKNTLSAGSTPLIVVDGVIYSGTIRDINPYDIESVDILKDASSAAVFGAKAASGVVIITTTKGRSGKPVINFSTKVGLTDSYNQRRGLGPDEYIEFRQDYFRQMYPAVDYNYYTNPGKLPSDLSVDQWRNLGTGGAVLEDNTNEWMKRLKLFPTEQKNYLAGKTMDMYDEVFRTGLRQEYDLSISGGTDGVKYYWSIGYNDNEGILVGDQFSSVRSRLNVDFQIVDWLRAGVNVQFSDRDDTSVPATMYFYPNSPYGEMYDEEGNLVRLPHGHTDNPLLANKRTSLSNKTNNLFANMFAEIKFPMGIKYKLSFQPRYQSYQNLQFVTISKELGGVANEPSTGQRTNSSVMSWMVDNLITWNKTFDVHTFDVTLLASVEENRNWWSRMENKNFQPNQNLGYHNLQSGDTPVVSSNDDRSTGDALMARLNYSLMGRYLLTSSIRRDGYSAFGLENPRATFPSVALGWIVSEEDFFNSNVINRLKLRASWGVNGNRDIGIYSALARVYSQPWYDGTNVRRDAYNLELSNRELKWEKTAATNIGIDIALLDNRIDLSADFYHMTTTDLLMQRALPQITGYQKVMANLGELQNRGMEFTLNTKNIQRQNFGWNSTLSFSLNRNKIIDLFGDYSTYTLLNEERTGDVPDFTNGWFPGEAIDVVWNYDVTGIWQLDEKAEAAKYNLQPGDFKAVDVDDDGKYSDRVDKKFIGHTQPRYRIGFRNDFNFLKNFTASIFIRSDLGHIGSYKEALNDGNENFDRFNRNNGPVPYWTADKPNNEYARLNPYTGAYGGGIMIYKPRSFVRIQDVSLSYNFPITIAEKIKLNNLQVYVSVRNLATFTDWPGWDPESGMSPMPRTFTLGFNLSL